ncbi:MAG: glycosyltransferase family 39 protein [Chloroflexi bacterium]|nr:glycosyltransferase family 39 protein [Chloroflexota bacterium]
MLPNRPVSISDQPVSGRSRLVCVGVLLVLFFLGSLVRMVDLKDPPLGFNPTRQLRSAIIARGIFYASQPESDTMPLQLAPTHWNMMERLEPSVLEWIVASTYRLMGEEQVWVARIYTTTFWLIGAVALYDLARRMTSPLGALVGVGYFLFLPFSILASRSFQPDPGMIMFVLLTGWSLFRWSERRSWRWALLAGIFGGAAAFVKVMAAFFVGGMALGTVIYSLGLLSESRTEEDPGWRIRNLKSSLGNAQVWIMAALMAAPALAYYLAGSGEQSSSYFVNWTIFSRWQHVLSPSFFMRWLIRVSSLMEPSVVLAAFVGTLLLPPRSRALLWGFWGSYFIYGLTFPHHITTHDYYHLPLLALVSMSLPALAALVIDKVQQRGIFIQILLVVVALVAAIYNAWIGRSILMGQDFSGHPAYWQDVGDAIPADAKLVGVTQDYGFRLMYYGWRTIKLWPQGAGSENFDERVGEADYFVITAKNQINDELKDYLDTSYPVYAEGVGYIIYNLHP